MSVVNLTKVIRDVLTEGNVEELEKAKAEMPEAFRSVEQFSEIRPYQDPSSYQDPYKVLFTKSVLYALMPQAWVVKEQTPRPEMILFGKGNNFDNQTGLANLGVGRISNIDIHDLKGNVVKETYDVDPTKTATSDTATYTPKEAVADIRDARTMLPLLRYINLSGTTIELRYVGDKITASTTNDGVTWKQVIKDATPSAVLAALSERAFNFKGHKVEVTNPLTKKPLGQLVDCTEQDLDSKYDKAGDRSFED